MGAIVKAPLITARTKNDRVIYLYSGDVVPDDLTKESLDHLRSLGFIEDAQAGPDADAADAPSGNASLEAWQEYARTQGASDDDLDGLSRNDLRDKYSD